MKNWLAVLFFILASPISWAEFGTPVRPYNIDGNLVFRAPVFLSGEDNFIAIGRAWNGVHYTSLISSFLLSGGWANSGFSKSSTAWYPGQKFYDFSGAGNDNMCMSGVKVYDGYIIACRSMKQNGFYEIYLIKYSLTGTLMTQFGTNGVMETGLGGDTLGRHAFVRGIVYNSDVNTGNYGVVTIVGSVGDYAPDDFHPFIASFDQATGAAYASAVTISSLSGSAIAMAFSTDYYFVASETDAPHGFHVYRYRHNAGTPTTLEAVWSQTSLDFTDVGGGTESVPGGIVTDGTDVYVVGSNKVDSSTPPWRCAVVDLLASNGNLNTDYGDVTITGGTDSEGYSIFSHDGANPDVDCILNAAVLSGTDLIALGTVYSESNSNYDTYSAKLNSTGALVGAYGSSGHKVVAVGSGDDVLYGGFIESSVLYVVGRAHDADLYQGGLVHRITPATGAYYKTLSSLDVAFGDSNIPKGQTTTTTVTATYSDTSTATAPSASLVWSSSDTAIATVSAAGVASGVSNGTATMTATTGSGGVSDTSGNLTVTTAQNAFVTATSYTGAQVKGLYGADLRCEIEAYNNGLTGGPWRAVLSSEATSAASRLTISSTVKNYRSDADGGEQTVAADSTEFWSGVLSNTIDYTIAGASVGGQAFTGSTSAGAIDVGNTCTSWTSTSDNGIIGNTNSTNPFPSGGTGACSSTYRLYCLSGQSAHAAPPNPSAFAKVTAGRTRATLSFTSGGGTTAGYRLAYRLGSSAPSTCLLSTQISALTVGPLPSTYSFDGLSPGRQYTFRACASNSDQSSLSSGVTATFTTPTVDSKAFVTADSYTGNLGGVYPADLRCQIAAVNAGLSGTYKAILSTEATAANAHITVTQPIYNTRKIADGGPQLVADTSTDLWSGAVLANIDYTTAGASVGGQAFTGSTSAGAIDAGNTCTSWTSTSNNGIIGNTNSANPFPSGGTGACSSTYRLYCVGAQSSSATPPDPASFSANSTGRTLVNFAFSSGGGTTAGYRLAYQTGGTAPADCVSGTQVSAYTIGANKIDYSLSGLSASTQYSFRLCASNSDQTAFSTGLTLTLTTAAYDARAFVTTDSYTGSLGGVYPADLRCQIAAVNAGFSGSYRAILSNEATAANARITITRPFYNTNGAGQLVAKNSAELWSGALPYLIDYDTAGASVGGQAFTGSTSAGAIDAGNTCTSWTSTSNNGIIGNTNSDNPFPSGGTGACSSTYRLYCVGGQASAATPSDPASFDTNTVGRTLINFSFSSGGGTTAGFRLAYQTGGTAPADCVSGTQVSAYTIGANKTDYSLSGLAASTEYSFRLCASNSDQTAYSTGLTLTRTTTAADARIFVSSNSYDGNLKGEYSADMRCQGDANTAGFTGVYKAILSTEATAANARIAVTKPFYNTNGAGQLVAKNSTELWSGALPYLIDYDRAGASVGGQAFTGSTSAGAVDAGNTCTSWTSTSNNGIIGNTNSADPFPSGGTGACSSTYRLYCVGGQTAAAAPADPASFTENTHDASSVTFDFTSGGGTTAGYKLAYDVGGTAPADCNSGTTVDPFTIGPGATTYMVSGLAGATQYSFRLCASNSDASAFSAGLTLSVTTN